MLLYKNDNLLDSAHTEYRQISTGEVEVGLGEFVMDSGLVVSAVSVKLKEPSQTTGRSWTIIAR